MMNQCTVTGVAPVKEVDSFCIFPLNSPPRQQGLESREQRLAKHPNSLRFWCTVTLALDHPGSHTHARTHAHAHTHIPLWTRGLCNFLLCQKSAAPWSSWHAPTDASRYPPWWNHQRKPARCTILTQSTRSKWRGIFILLQTAGCCRTVYYTGKIYFSLYGLRFNIEARCWNHRKLLQ